MPLIETDNLEKVYATDGVETSVLRGVSFNIDAGEFVSIMGPSGSGKSTLLHILGFLEGHSKGAYRFNGKTMDDYKEEELAHLRNKKMGFVFQSFNLLPKTSVFENVKLPLLYSKTPSALWNEKASLAIESVGLSHRKNHLSSQLSGGEKQRVAIARALVNDPEVLFADEPTGNLDSASGEVVMEILAHLNKEGGHTIVLITHETYTAQYAGRIIHLRDGKIESDEAVSKHYRKGDGLVK